MTEAAAQAQENKEALDALIESMQQYGVMGSKATSQSGLLEKAEAKLWATFNKNPLVKVGKQVKAMVTGTKAMLKQAQKQSDWSKEDEKDNKKKMTGLQQLTAGLLTMSSTQKSYNKMLGTNAGLLKKIMVSFLSLFGIFLIIGVGLAALSIAFQGANSPMLTMTENMGIIHNAMEGLLMIIHGEGEGGLTGAMNVAIIAFVAFAAIAMVFSVPVGIAVGFLMLMVGTFQLVKKATGDTVTAVLAALAVAVVGVAAVAAFMGATATVLSAAVLLPVAVIVAGFAAVWAAFTGKAPVWVGIIGAFAIAAALAFLFPVIAIPALIAAVVVGIILIMVRSKDESIAFILGIGTWFKNNWLRALVFMGVIAIAIVLWPITLAALVIGVLWKFKDEVIGIVMFIPRLIWNYLWKPLIDAVGVFFGLGENAGDRFKDWLKGLWDGLMDIIGIDSFVGNMKGVIGTIVGILETPINFIKGAINDWIIAPINDILMWSPPLTKETLGGLVGVGQITPLARGGIITGPTTARLGEQGPEAVIPLSKTGFGGGGLGGSMTVNINVSGVTDRTDKRRLAREISDILAQEMRRQGGATTRGHF